MKLNKAKQEDESQYNERIQEKNWQIFDQNFGDFDKLKCMVELGKRLEKFALMIQGKGYGIADLRKELHEIRKIKPKSVQLLVGLTETDEILVTVRILNDAHRNKILKDILNNRKDLSEEIVAEGAKCSLVTNYARTVNLYQAWSMVSEAKLTKNNAKEEINKIEATFEDVKTICLQAKQLMAKYTASNDQQEKKSILETLKVKTKEINELYEKCFQMIQKIDLQVDSKIIQLQFLNFEQNEAKKTNIKLSKGKLSLGCIGNPIKLLEPLVYGTGAGVNYLTTKSIETTKDKLIKISEKLGEKLYELKQLANAIKEVTEEAQTFIEKQIF